MRKVFITEDRRIDIYCQRPLPKKKIFWFEYKTLVMDNISVWTLEVRHIVNTRVLRTSGLSSVTPRDDISMSVTPQSQTCYLEGKDPSTWVDRASVSAGGWG